MQSFPSLLFLSLGASQVQSCYDMLGILEAFNQSSSAYPRKACHMGTADRLGRNLEDAEAGRGDSFQGRQVANVNSSSLHLFGLFLIPTIKFKCFEFVRARFRFTWYTHRRRMMNNV
jgi:hypothetical protein